MIRVEFTHQFTGMPMPRDPNSGIASDSPWPFINTRGFWSGAEEVVTMVSWSIRLVYWQKCRMARWCGPADRTGCSGVLCPRFKSRHMARCESA